MKTFKFTEYELLLLEEALGHIKELISNEKFPKNSIVTKEFVENTITELQKKLAENN